MTYINASNFMLFSKLRTYFASCVWSQILTGVLSILISIWLERCFMTFIVSTDCVSVYNTSDLVTFIMPGCKAKQPFLWQESANTYQVWYVLQIMVGFYCLGLLKIYILIFCHYFPYLLDVKTSKIWIKFNHTIFSHSRSEQFW